MKHQNWYKKFVFQHFKPLLLSKLLCSFRDFCSFILASFKFFLHHRDLVTLCLFLSLFIIDLCRVI